MLFVCGFCVTHLHAAFFLFSVFRRMVTCSTMLFLTFLTCQSIRTTNRFEKSSWNFWVRLHQRARSVYLSHVIGVAPPTSPFEEEHHQTSIGFNPFGVSLATPMKELLRPSASLSCLGDPMPSTVPASTSIFPHSHIDALCRFGPCVPRA